MNPIGFTFFLGISCHFLAQSTCRGTLFFRLFGRRAGSDVIEVPWHLPGGGRADEAVASTLHEHLRIAPNCGRAVSRKHRQALAERC
eukprot:Skav221388  [mRNA]  locus=scaffold4031:45821:47273:+ [translate_table: standard]